MPPPRLPGVLLGLVAAAVVLVPLPAQRSDAALPDGRARRSSRRASSEGRPCSPTAPRARSFPGSWPATATPCLARRAPPRVLERAQREPRDLRRGRDDRRGAAPDGQSQARRPEARVVARRAPHRLAGRRARPACRRVRDARGRREEAPPRARAEPRHRPGVVARRDAHRVRLESQRRLRPLDGREGGRRAGVAARRPRRRPGAGVEPGRHAGRLQRGERRRHEHLDPARRHARDGARHPLPGGRPAPRLVARREPPGLRPLRSRPLAHLGHPGARRHRPAHRGHRGRHRPRLGDRGAGARARPARAPARPRPACAGRPRRDRAGRAGSSSDSRLRWTTSERARSGSAAGGRPGWPACAPTR